MSKDKYRSNTGWVIHPLASDQNFTAPAETSAQKDGGKIRLLPRTSCGRKGCTSVLCVMRAHKVTAPRRRLAGTPAFGGTPSRHRFRNTTQPFGCDHHWLIEVSSKLRKSGSFPEALASATRKSIQCQKPRTSKSNKLRN